MFSRAKKEVGSDGCSARRLDAVKKSAEHFLVLIIVHAGPFLAVSPLAAVHRSVGIKKGALAVSLAFGPAAKIFAAVRPAHEVEATDQEAAELSTEPADYSVYPAGEGAEIAAATDELALAAKKNPNGTTDKSV